MPMPGQSPKAGSRRRWRVRMLRLLLFSTCGYVMVLGVLWGLENRLLYFPAGVEDWTEPEDLRADDVWLEAADGTRIHAWWCPKSGSDGAILYAHGNGGNLSHRTRIYRELQSEQDLSVLAFDYKGYGKSGGKPSEAGCYAAADAAYDWLTENERNAVRTYRSFRRVAGRRGHGGSGIAQAVPRDCSFQHLQFRARSSEGQVPVFSGSYADVEPV